MLEQEVQCEEEEETGQGKNCQTETYCPTFPMAGWDTWWSFLRSVKLSSVFALSACCPEKWRTENPSFQAWSRIACKSSWWMLNCTSLVPHLDIQTVTLPESDLIAVFFARKECIRQNTNSIQLYSMVSNSDNSAVSLLWVMLLLKEIQ